MAGIVATLASTEPGSRGNLRAERYTVSNGQPTIASASGLGTGGVAVSILSGYDAHFAFRITTGSTTLVAGTLANITLANVLASTPNPALSPASVNAAAASEATMPYAVAVALGTIQIRGGSLTPSTTYDFVCDSPDAKVTLSQTATWLATVESIETSMPILTRSVSGNVATLGVRPDFGSTEMTLLGRG